MKNILIITGILLFSYFPVQAAIISGSGSGATAGTNVTVSGSAVSLADPITNSSGTVRTFNTTSMAFNGDAIAQTSFHVMQTPVTFSTSVSSASTDTNYKPSNITATITPTSTSSKILVIVNGEFSTASTTVGAFGFFSLFRGSTNLGDTSFGFGYVTNFITSAVTPDDYAISFSTLDSPATTSATTYTVYMKSQASETVTFQRASVPGTITLIEVK